MEADGLRWSLLVIGSLVIVGLAVHGIWLSRKNNDKKANASKHKNDQEYQPSGWQSDTEGVDEQVSYAGNDSDENLDIKFDIGLDEVASDVANETSTKNEFDDLGFRYDEKRNYLVGFLPKLLELEKQGIIKVNCCNKIIGSEFHDGWTFLKWEKIK